ncbi:MAG: putative toxin-antitoxin system toxin component, PIN family [Actinobacteria bacterium]|nr:putative toxin-antitoxin system toxin component, PIN family [Actinomycetota bacterium]
MRVLLDTNVLVSAILFGGVPRQLLEAALTGDLDLITSQPLLAELETVLTRKFEFPSSMTSSIRAELEALSEVVEPIPIKRVTRTVADDVVLATAVAGAAEVLVTGDKELLGIGSYEAIPIQSPRNFADTLEPRKPT